jgi:hypothetical protein
MLGWNLFTHSGQGLDWRPRNPHLQYKHKGPINARGPLYLQAAFRNNKQIVKQAKIIAQQLYIISNQVCCLAMLYLAALYFTTSNAC